jgi:hypothetical protein
MRITKLFLMIVFVGLIAFTIGSCKMKCKHESAEVGFRNNGNSVASVKIKVGGNSMTDPEVPPHTSMQGYAAFGSGDTFYTIKVDDSTYTKTISTCDCYTYVVAIDSINNITVNTTQRKYKDHF